MGKKVLFPIVRFLYREGMHIAGMVRQAVDI